MEKLMKFSTILATMGTVFSLPIAFFLQNEKAFFISFSIGLFGMAIMIIILMFTVLED